jgi:gluconolactonase
VNEEGSLGAGKRFADTPGPDGLKVDVEGRVWTTAADGVRVYSPSGELVETIAFPQKPANCAFGGADGKTLYVTARTGLYKVATTVEGIRAAKR